MTKEEAADFLGVSVRTLQRHVKNGRIKVTYKHSKSGGTEAVFDKDELSAFKEELDRGEVRAVVVPPQRQANAIAATPRDMSQLVALVAATVRETLPALQQPATHVEATLSDLAAKPLLKLNEAARLTGLSRDILRAAIEARALKAKIVGRAWRIKQVDLSDYIKRL
jgi:excisionase family DNA binding protein